LEPEVLGFECDWPMVKSAERFAVEPCTGVDEGGRYTGPVGVTVSRM
jgi:hypothetical protein